MTNYIGAIGTTIATTLAVINLSAVIPMEEQLKEEQRINAYTVDQFNKMSTKAKKLQDRAEELKDANEALIRVCDPSKVDRVIPLPKLKG